MPLAGGTLATVAPRRVVQVGLLAVAGLLPVMALVGSPWELFAVLTGWGAGIGIVDVGMNTEASAVQEHLGRRIMSSFHAAYSGGGLVGAALGAVAAASGVTAEINFLIAGLVALVIGTASADAFARRGSAPSAELRLHGSRWPKCSWTLVSLAAMAFGCFLAEGAVTDWSAVYLHSSLGASPAVAAVGYTVFSCVMTAGRLLGDRLADRMGPVRLVGLSSGTAAVSFGGALFVSRVWAGLAGLALLGAGLSFVVPLIFTAASRIGRPGPNLAMVTSCGYLGLLAGPALIGGLAEAVSLPAALGTVAVLSGLTAVLARAVRPAHSPPGAMLDVPEEVPGR
jgi:predicted MFS family arabinose efflux permease